MARISAKDREQIAKMGARLQRDVVVDLFTQRESPLIVPGVVPCETCTVVEEVLAELQPLIPHVKVQTHDLVGERELAATRGIDRVPTLAFDGDLAGRIRFVGAPLGYEFASFLSSIFEVGGTTKAASDTGLTRLAGVAQPVNLKVFVTPT